MMRHDYNTTGKKHGNPSNSDDSSTNAELEENITNHISPVQSLQEMSFLI